MSNAVLKTFFEGKAVCANCKNMRGDNEYDHLTKCVAFGEGTLTSVNYVSGLTKDMKWSLSTPSGNLKYGTTSTDPYPSFPRASNFNLDGDCSRFEPTPPAKEVLKGKLKQLLGAFKK